MIILIILTSADPSLCIIVYTTCHDMVWLPYQYWFHSMPGGASKGKVKKHFKAKHQKKRVFRSSDPVISVFMWGVNHTVSVCNLLCKRV